MSAVLIFGKEARPTARYPGLPQCPALVIRTAVTCGRRMEQMEIRNEGMPVRIVRSARRRLTPRKLAILVAVALIHVGAVIALLRAFDIDIVPDAVKSIASVTVALPPQPEPPDEKVEEIEPEGAAAEEAAKAKPVEASAPPVVAPKRQEQVAPVSSTGDETRSGAATDGPGTGGGGPGVGTGRGGEGTGSGGIPYARHAEKIAGEIRSRDYPRSSARERDGAFVIVHFTVTPQGTTRDCRVARSSGNVEVDRITCRLVVERFRYRPAIDGNGNPTSEKVGWKQWWWR